jgi:uncharacterized protein DUF4136
MISTPRLARKARTVRTLSVFAVALSTLVVSACYSVRVQSLGRPSANFAQYRTFKILDAPHRPEGAPVIPRGPAAEPMLNNSITYDAGREFLKEALEARGFVEDKKNPDFTVAFYASARERLNINNWGYGYGYGNFYVTEYTEGTVLIDLVDPDTKKLVWRGSGVATVSDNPRKYLKELSRIVPKIVDRIPSAYASTVVADR